MGLALHSGNYGTIPQSVVSSYPFTMCGWFRVPSAGSYLSLVGLRNPTTGVHYDVYYSGHTTGQVGANAYVGGGAVANSTVAATPGQWFHAAGVFVSDTERHVYLDGGNMGFNATARAFAATNLLYVGNSISGMAVDAADVAVFDAALNSADVAALAAGVSPLLLARSHGLVIYQDLLNRLNRPGFGPALTAAAGASFSGHPRAAYAGLPRRLAALRVPGPWRSTGQQLAATGAAAGQTVVAGAAGDSLRTFGEVVS